MENRENRKTNRHSRRWRLAETNRGRTGWCDGKSESRRFLACLGFTLLDVCDSSRVAAFSGRMCTAPPPLPPAHLLLDNHLQVFQPRPRPFSSLSPAPSRARFPSLRGSHPLLPPTPPRCIPRGIALFVRRGHENRNESYLDAPIDARNSAVGRFLRARNMTAVMTSLPTRAGHPLVETFREILLHFDRFYCTCEVALFQSLQRLRQRKRGLGDRERTREWEGGMRPWIFLFITNPKLLAVMKPELKNAHPETQ